MNDSARKTYEVKRKYEGGCVLSEIGKGKRRKRRVEGRFPELYPTMRINALVVEGRLKDIEVVQCRHNLNVLVNNAIDVLLYLSRLRRYVQVFPFGYGWNEAKLTRWELYQHLSFCDADRIHKIIYDNAEESSRVEAIIGRVLNYGRESQHIVEYDRETFFRIAGIVQKDATYPAFSEAELLSFVDKDERFVKTSKGGLRDKEMDAFFRDVLKTPEEEVMRVLFDLEGEGLVTMGDAGKDIFLHFHYDASSTMYRFLNGWHRKKLELKSFLENGPTSEEIIQRGEEYLRWKERFPQDLYLDEKRERMRVLEAELETLRKEIDAWDTDLKENEQ